MLSLENDFRSFRRYLKTLSKYEFDEASIVLMEGGLVMIHEGRLVGINFDLVVLGCFYVVDA